MDNNLNNMKLTSHTLFSLFIRSIWVLYWLYFIVFIIAVTMSLTGEIEGRFYANFFTTDELVFESNPIQKLDILQNNKTVAVLQPSKWAITLENPSYFLKFGTLIFSLLLFAFLYFPLKTLKAFFENISHGNLFNIENVRRLNQIGSYILIYLLINYLGYTLFKYIIVNSYSFPLKEGNQFSITFSFESMPFLWLGVALFFFLLANAFKQAILLKEDHDLTI